MDQFQQQPQAPAVEYIDALLQGYDVTKLVAMGGMGAIYHARQSFFDREVAIKLVLSHAMQNPEMMRQFQAEAQSMALLDHDNIIRVFDSGEIEGMPYIIMEYISGSSLYEAINGHPIEPLQAAEITMQVCAGLAHAHDEDILHRDIKPENIMLANGCQVKIADFGLARDQFDPEVEETIWGSPGYIAPEIVMSPDTVDCRADVYSVGCMLYAMLTGFPPNPHMLDLSPISWCDHRFIYLIQKSMSHDAEHRYQNCREFSSDLALLIDSLKRHNSTGAAVPVMQPVMQPVYQQAVQQPQVYQQAAPIEAAVPVAEPSFESQHVEPPVVPQAPVQPPHQAEPMQLSPQIEQ